MTPKDWLAFNPRHRITLASESGGRVRAQFSGGEGVDQRFAGVGDDELEAEKNGLQAREAIKSALP